MIDIWREVNLNMSLSNDMLSLRKEIKHGDIDSIIPVLVFNRGMTVQEGIAVSHGSGSGWLEVSFSKIHQDTCKELQKNIDRFDLTANELLEIVKQKQPELVEDVESYMTGCRYNQTANLLWRYVTKVCFNVQYKLDR